MKKRRHFYYELHYIRLYGDLGVWNKQNASAIVQDLFQASFDLLKIKFHKLSEGYFILRGL